MFSLLGKLREHPKLRECSLQVGYGVIVPDCEASPESMGPDALIWCLHFVVIWGTLQTRGWNAQLLAACMAGGVRDGKENYPAKRCR